MELSLVLLFAALETSKCTAKKLFVAPSFATNDSWETKGVRGPSLSSTKALSCSLTSQGCSLGDDTVPYTCGPLDRASGGGGTGRLPSQKKYLHPK